MTKSNNWRYHLETWNRELFTTRIGEAACGKRLTGRHLSLGETWKNLPVSAQCTRCRKHYPGLHATEEEITAVETALILLRDLFDT